MNWGIGGSFDSRISRTGNRGLLTKSNTHTTLMDVIMGSRHLLGLLHNIDCKFNHVVIDPALALHDLVTTGHLKERHPSTWVIIKGLVLAML
jgi:hypothetical protein